MKNVYAFALVAMLFLVGCASDPRLDTDTIYLGGRRVTAPGTESNAANKRMNFDNVSYWDGDSVAGSPRIRINLGEQIASLDGLPLGERDPSNLSLDLAADNDSVIRNNGSDAAQIDRNLAVADFFSDYRNSWRR